MPYPLNYIAEQASWFTSRMSDFSFSCVDGFGGVDFDIIQKCAIVMNSYNQHIREFLSEHGEIIEDILYGTSN